MKLAKVSRATAHELLVAISFERQDSPYPRRYDARNRLAVEWEWGGRILRCTVTDQITMVERFERISATAPRPKPTAATKAAKASGPRRNEGLDVVHPERIEQGLRCDLVTLIRTGIDWMMESPPPTGPCRQCGCTAAELEQWRHTGTKKRGHWAEPDLCSFCLADGGAR